MVALRFPTVDEILRTHEEILARSGGSRGVLQRGSLEAALDRAIHGPFLHAGSVAEGAGLLLRGIAQDRPFADGNKRTGFALAETFLHGNGFHREASPDEVVAFMLQAARIEIDVDGIRRWIEAHLRKA